MRETELDPCVHTVGLHCLYCLHEGVCVRPLPIMRFLGGIMRVLFFLYAFFFNYAHLYAHLLAIYARFTRFSGGLLITISPHEEHLLA